MLTKEVRYVFTKDLGSGRILELEFTPREVKQLITLAEMVRTNRHNYVPAIRLARLTVTSLDSSNSTGTLYNARRVIDWFIDNPQNPMVDTREGAPGEFNDSDYNVMVEFDGKGATVYTTPAK